MIASLRGQLVSTEENAAVVDVNGVGYEVRLPESVRLSLPLPGEQVELFIRTLFNEEDGMLLYGFNDPWQRKLFDLLITVSGVGPRLAMNLMSATEPETLARAISLKDARRLQALPGIGSKLAQRLILELTDKVAEISFERQVDRLAAGTGQDGRLLEELTESLIGLGYRRQEAQRAVEAALRNRPGSDEQTLLREALRLASERKT